MMLPQTNQRKKKNLEKQLLNLINPQNQANQQKKTKPHKVKPIKKREKNLQENLEKNKAHHRNKNWVELI
jgi:hypothetical protein